MFEFIAGVMALGLAAQIAFWLVAGVLFPLFWLWMLVDSIFRNDHEYPSNNNNEKILWIVLMVMLQIACVFYFFMVYRKIERGRSDTAVSSHAPSAHVGPESGM